MIEVKNLTKKFGNITAVDDISFKVEKGKIWGFLGPNGAGKTTTMRILTGFLPPSEGIAYINGIDVSKNPVEIKRKVGYLPEVVPVYPELTVKEYLYFVAEISSIEKQKIKNSVEKVVERTNLKSVYRRLIKNISRGYRQRLGIAQAIINDPEILILDEPTIGLDPAQIIEIREMIKSFKEHSTVILSSHILPEISQVCDGAVVIKEGKLRANITREEWSKNLEITVKNPEIINKGDMIKSINEIKDIEINDNSIVITLDTSAENNNNILDYLIKKKVGINEVKAGLEGLYMNIISGYERREK